MSDTTETVIPARATLGSVFNPRRNSLTMVRLFFAVMVVSTHAFTLGAFGLEPHLGSSSYGGLALVGFFAVSGYFITASGVKTSPGRFLWHRALRVYPAYWVTLLLVAFVLAPLSYVVAGRSLADFPGSEAATYVLKNLTLFQGQTTIPGTLDTAGSRTTAWNGAIWTLFFEFICYLGIAALSVAGLLRTRVIATLAALVTAYSLIAYFVPAVVPAFLKSYYPGQMVLTGSLFLGGSLVYFLRDRLPASWWLAAGAGAVGAAATFTPGVPSFVAGFGFGIFVIRVCAALPQPSFFNGVDLSYGFYLVAFPVGQVLAVAGFHRVGLAGYLAATVLPSLAFAFLSWYAIESRALRYRKSSFGRKSATAAP